jgi:hypothetical protein
MLYSLIATARDGTEWEGRRNGGLGGSRSRVASTDWRLGAQEDDSAGCWLLAAGAAEVQNCKTGAGHGYEAKQGSGMAMDTHGQVWVGH